MQFEAAQRAVMGGYLKWEDNSTGGGGGESEAATAEAQGGGRGTGGDTRVNHCLDSQSWWWVWNKLGKDGVLVRVYIECSSKGLPAGRTEGVQPCRSQHHGTL